LDVPQAARHLLCTLDASMKLSFLRSWPFIIWLALCALGGALGTWLFEIPFLYGAGIFAVCLFLNGELAEIEDNEPGGFNNPDGKSK
jgi:hypothetical protein